jgi:hypothetical protein
MGPGFRWPSHLSIRAVLYQCLCGAGLLPLAAWGASLSLTLDDLQGEHLAARQVRILWSDAGAGSAQLQVGELRLGEKLLRDVQLLCGDFALGRVIRCEQGKVLGGTPLDIAFRYDTQAQRLSLSVGSESLGQGLFEAQRMAAGWGMRLRLDKLDAAALAGWLPPARLAVSAGRISGAIAYGPEGGGRLEADLALDGLAFSDAAGSRAAEGLGGPLKLSARRDPAGWRWQFSTQWDQGELFWQPFYFQAGHRLAAGGLLTPAEVVVESASLHLSRTGVLQASGNWSREQDRLTRGHVQVEGARLAGLYEVVFKPLLAGTALGDLETEGRVDFSLDWEAGQARAVRLGLTEVHAEDRQGRFALYGLEGDIPWQDGATGEGWLSWSGGHVRRLPFGAVRAPFRFDAEGGVRVPVTAVAIAGGWLEVNGLSARRHNGQWHWRFGGQLADASMEQLSSAFGWPVMHGTLAAGVPLVSYDGQDLAVDGLLVFRVFDGTILAQGLRVRDTLGRVPVLTGDIRMRSLDLDLLTRAFSFGSITGRVDVDVQDLELVNWKPSRFDARVASSEGSYPRRISQRAVQNISSLGGAGAGAAIQRSFLAFFEQFGYERIGLSCVLRNGICLMGGVEPSAQGYVIVKGGGIPAITVMGYNRQVGWDDLLSRLSRVTEKNFKPIVE